jgi:hypothetical protein
MTPESPIRLTESQQAAVAKLACGCEQPGSVSLICGPRGVGKTTVLAQLADAASVLGRTVGRAALHDWAAGAGTLPDIVLADDAHEADGEAIVRLAERCRVQRPAASLVLAGEGRLFTVVSRDSRIEQAVRLRVALPAFTCAESVLLFETVLDAGAGRRSVAADRTMAGRTAHEIAAGVPAAVIRLAELARVVADSRSDRELSAADIEAIHRRLSLHAA